MKKKYESVRIFGAMMTVFMVLVFAVFAVVIPIIFRNIVVSAVELKQLVTNTVTICSWMVGLPIILALWISIRVCRELYLTDDFTRYTATALRQISFLALAEAVILIGCGILFYFSALHRLLILLFSAVLMLAALAVFVFCRVLARIVDNALDIKEENQFTI